MKNKQTNKQTSAYTLRTSRRERSGPIAPLPQSVNLTRSGTTALESDPVGIEGIPACTRVFSNPNALESQRRAFFACVLGSVRMRASGYRRRDRTIIWPFAPDLFAPSLSTINQNMLSECMQALLHAWEGSDWTLHFQAESCLRSDDMDVKKMPQLREPHWCVHNVVSVDLHLFHGLLNGTNELAHCCALLICFIVLHVDCCESNPVI